jgi:hypothetical protein
MDAARPPIYQYRPVVACHRSFVTASTDTIGLLSELDALLTLENYNGFTLQASPHSYKSARDYIESAARRIRMRILRPEFEPDGEGGIDIEWEKNGKRLALSCRAQEDQPDFISWREPNGRYDGREATEELLIEKLDWLSR